MIPPAVSLTCRIGASTDNPQVVARFCLESTDNEATESGSSLYGNKSTSTDGMAVPDSVLVYERQLRKAQHERKAGKSLSSSDLQVLHEDDHLVVVNKPPGVLTVPGIHSKASLLDLVHEKYGQNMTDPVKMIVHRLDMDTSGIVVFGRTIDATKRLHALFRDHKVDKQYECLIMGHLPIPGSLSKDGWIEIDLPLQRDHEHPPFMRVSTPRSESAAMKAVDDLQQHGFRKLVRKKPKQSKTLIRIVEQLTVNDSDDTLDLAYTRLRLEPITGRTHQLRVHCAALGYPIIGDPTYSHLGEAGPVGGLQSIGAKLIGDERETPFTRCDIGLQEAWMRRHPVNVRPMCLHAAFLRFRYVSWSNGVKQSY